MFSRRTRWDLEPDPLAAELTRLRNAGLPVYDLTASNPTTAGFEYPIEQIQAAIAAGGAQPYAPEPFGLLSARRAVAEYYASSHMLEVAPERIVLAAGTSELYSYCFRLLCDPGDEVLLAQPSYPLFDYLAALDNVSLRQFSLVYESAWHLDRRGVQLAVTPRTRAIAVIHPNNPTGHFTPEADRLWLAEFCADRKLALIVDEVFLDYPLEAFPGCETASFLAARMPCLTLVMSGLSKVSGLPQMKLAWLCLHGPQAVVTEASDRLEVIADSFLSPGTPVQHAAGAMLAVRHTLQSQVAARLRRNLRTLDATLAACPQVSRLKIEGGWYAILRTSTRQTGNDVALELLQTCGVHVHPGSFFGLPDSGYLVVSLLTSPETLGTGLSLALHELSRRNC